MSLSGGLMFSIFPILFAVFFVLVAALIVFVIIKTVSRAAKNRNSPILTVEARIVTKRADVSGGMGDAPASTWHYAAFEVASGARLELPVTGEQYGLLAEGDVGMLTFQGTRFVGFQRRAPSQG